MCSFEEKVLNGIKKCGISNLSGLKIGAGVSGGADSISLLISLSNILSPLGLTLYVITVNHNIRAKEESSGDANFVLNLCKNLSDKGFLIKAKCYEIEEGQVSALAKERSGGIEDAARELRYEAFESFIKKNKLDYLCLAHNQNDQLETLLMRFFNGATLEALAGIKSLRGKYIRPLLDISRGEIEVYLKEKEQDFRTDKTNFDELYLRNKIRLKLMPFLDQNMGGWRKALLGANGRYQEDADFILDAVKDFPLEPCDGGIKVPLNDFLNLAPAIQNRVLIKAANMAGEDSRIPQAFLVDCLKALKSTGKINFTKHYNKVQVVCNKNNLLVKKYDKSQTDFKFFVIIEESGIYELPFGQLNVSKNDDSNAVLSSNEEYVASICRGELISSFKLKLPVIVRSVSLDDEIKSADGKMKKVSDILNDWKLSDLDRSLLPVFQVLESSEQSIIALAGSFLGYKDWIVKL